jgi:ATP-dependent Clp protease protease subunit
MSDLIKDFGLFARDHKVSTTTLEAYGKHVDTQARFIEPVIVEERQLNATQISVFSRLFMDRILFLGSEVDSDVANVINAQLLFLASQNPDKDIQLYINSPGGSVNAGLSMYDTMNFINPDVSTTCMGMAASMGAILLSSGAKGKRFALPHSEIMIHQPLSNTGMVQASDMEIHWNEVKKCKNTLYNILSENTGKSFEEIEKAGDRNNWFTGYEAAEYGLIDTVIKKK